MKNFKMIVGLSNPLKKYYNTRHNIGSWFIKHLSKKFDVKLNIKKKFYGYIGLWKYFNNFIYLLIPNIYMNLNGISVYSTSSFYKIKSDNILIIQDDLNTAIGKTKFIISCNNYGHNGIKNIISKFEKHTLFKRICVGIGRPSKNNISLSSYVLSSPSKEEKKSIINSINNSIHIIEKFIKL
ncbi:aminoacyl-tRNA hydrolase [Buchnera aphidicola (Pseudoregma panicola)]|uniref:aminoacyl-tRNA hydrolase n=1 Tax=Buchnera aphidicola TaxID=9 RepID=UPI0031B6C35B